MLIEFQRTLLPVADNRQSHVTHAPPLIVTASCAELGVPGAHRGVLAARVAWRAINAMGVNAHVLAVEVANQTFLDSKEIRLALALVRGQLRGARTSITQQCELS